MASAPAAVNGPWRYPARAVTGEGQPTTSAASALDALAAAVIERSGCVFTVATTEAERHVAYRLRYRCVMERGWASIADHPLGLERDEFDRNALQVIGRIDSAAVCTGRLVLPPGPLPTEVACGLRIEPAGRVVDAGRMVVVPGPEGPRPGLLIALLAALYSQARLSGFDVGCGMMAANVRSLARLVGLELEVLGPERLYHHEMRAPVRFEPGKSVRSLHERWTP
jgi:hypothetical protein